MQYHQIVIFFHRPWVSKNYIQPRYPRQGPGYLHARRMCIESSTAVARLLVLYEKHYTFRRMNNEVVAIIFTAALILLFISVSHSHLSPTPKANHDDSDNDDGDDDDDDIHDKMEYLNLCFRALDELGHSFDNAKRTREFLASLQRRWRVQMRKSGSQRVKRRQPKNQRHSGEASLIIPQQRHTLDDTTASRRKKSKLESRDHVPLPIQPASDMHPLQHPTFDDPSTQPLQQQQQQNGTIDWIAGSELQMQMFSDHLTGGLFSSTPPAVIAGDSSSRIDSEDNMIEVGTGLPSLSDLETWWGMPR